MTTQSSPSLARNTANTSTFAILSAYYAAAKSALRSHVPNAPLLRAKPLSPLPPTAANSSPANFNRSPNLPLSSDTAIANDCEKLEHRDRWIPPRWLILFAGISIGIFGTWSMTARCARPPVLPASTEPQNFARASAPMPSAFPLRSRNAYLFTVPSHGTYLLELQNGTLRGETSNGMVTLIPVAAAN